MAESSSETLRPKIPCTCFRASKCSLRCYARLPTLSNPPSSRISYSDRCRLKQHIRITFDNLHGFFLSTITPTSYFRNSGPPSLSIPSTSSTATTSADITNPPATQDLPSASSAITDQTLQTLHSILSRAHSRKQTLNSLTSSEDTSTEDTSTNTSTNKPKIPLSTFTALYTSLITDHELFLTDLAPYYREEWAEGEVKKLMAEFVGETGSTASSYVCDKR
ncbi:hypothetical protein B0H65DRAFT_509730 [Neurospora tetraspora]|uniref:Uncharacterized protein n=1 Tax=Neurospora tetraspora TaxID=94610 RepID=A0AAE0MQD8_9PEZI|nr:hypothetical protein B0H65DRAFT_509730 [Neurospora tetraspora]